MIHPLNREPYTSHGPTPCDVSYFQRELTALFGCEQLSGRPWLRIIWAQDEGRDRYGWIAKDWSEYGASGAGEWRRRYLYSSASQWDEAYDEARGIWAVREVWKDISPPRFVIERFIPPNVACLDWDKGLDLLDSNPNFATGRDEDGDPFTVRKAIEGIYVPLEIDDRRTVRGGVIADHDATCCANAEREQRMCYGSYAEPGDRQLDLIRRAAAIIKQDVERRPGVMTDAERALAQKRGADRYQQYWDGLEDRIARIAYEAVRTHRGMLSDDPSQQKWGTYHFLGAHTPSGGRKSE